MDNDEFRVGERCDINGCRSRKYRTNLRGFEECDRGHVHGFSQDRAQEADDDYGINTFGKTSRKIEEKPEEAVKCMSSKLAIPSSFAMK